MSKVERLRLWTVFGSCSCPISAGHLEFQLLLIVAQACWFNLTARSEIINSEMQIFAFFLPFSANGVNCHLHSLAQLCTWLWPATFSLQCRMKLPVKVPDCELHFINAFAPIQEISAELTIDMHCTNSLHRWVRLLKSSSGTSSEIYSLYERLL